jgi:hypothetical protein
MKPRQFDTEAPDVQLSMFAADSMGNTGPDLFTEAEATEATEATKIPADDTRSLL